MDDSSDAHSPHLLSGNIVDVVGDGPPDVVIATFEHSVVALNIVVVVNAFAADTDEHWAHLEDCCKNRSMLDAVVVHQRHSLLRHFEFGICPIALDVVGTDLGQHCQHSCSLRSMKSNDFDHRCHFQFRVVAALRHLLWNL